MHAMFWVMIAVTLADIGYAQNLEMTCGVQTNNITSAHGLVVFRSPNFPRNYPNRARCGVEVHSQADQCVRILPGRFNTESNYDFLRIYDDSLNLLRSYSGRNFNSDYVANPGEDIVLQFTSDGSLTKQGFELSIKVENCMVSPNVTMVPTQQSNVTTHRPHIVNATVAPAETTTYYHTGEVICHKDYSTWYLDDGPKVITSHNYPHGYSDNEDCSVYITPFTGQCARLDFIDFNTEMNYDYLSIYQKYSYSNRYVVDHQYTGEESSIPSFVSSPGSQLRINFTSDGSIVRRGFKIMITFFNCTADLTTTSPIRNTTSDQNTTSYLPRIVCGEYNRMLTSGPVEVVSTNFPQNYNSYDRCTVGIAPRPDMCSRIRILSFSTKPEDVVLVLEEYYGVVASYSGNSVNMTATQSRPGRRRNITFSSNNYYTETGFRFLVTFVPCGPSYVTTTRRPWHDNSTTAASPSGDVLRCLGNVTRVLTSGPVDLFSWNYPNNYDNNMDCSVYIEPPRDMCVHLDFLEINTESGYDHLYVDVKYPGWYNYQGVLRHHGQIWAPSFDSLPNAKVRIRFVSDGSQTRNGFHIRINIFYCNETSQNTSRPAYPEITTAASFNNRSVSTVVCGQFYGQLHYGPVDIISTNYPYANYSNNERCNVTIAPYQGWCAAVRLLSFSTLPGDYVNITRLSDNHVDHYEGIIYYGNRYLVESRSGERMNLSFVSNQYGTAHGFQYRVTFTPCSNNPSVRTVVCGQFYGQLQNGPVDIISTNYPNANYSNNERCNVTIAPYQGWCATVRLLSFSTLPGDYVNIVRLSDNHVDHYEGTVFYDYQYVVESRSGERMNLSFFSNQYGTARGFQYRVTFTPCREDTVTTAEPRNEQYLWDAQNLLRQAVQKLNDYLYRYVRN